MTGNRIVPQVSDPSTQKALELAFKYIYDLRDGQTLLANAHVQATQETQQQLEVSNAATQKLLTQIPGYDLLQAGSSSQLEQGQASVLPVVSTGLTWTAASGVVTWYTTGLQILLPSGTVVDVPDTTLSTPLIVATSLSPGTYLFYPYYNVQQKAVQFAQVTGASGLASGPQNPNGIAYASASVLAMQQQNGDGNINLAPGGISVTLPSMGSNTGTSTGRNM